MAVRLSRSANALFSSAELFHQNCTDSLVKVANTHYDFAVPSSEIGKLLIRDRLHVYRAG